MFCLISFVVISAKLLAMCPKKNEKSTKNSHPNMCNITNFSTPSTSDVPEQNLSQSQNFNLLDNDFFQYPNTYVGNFDSNLSDYNMQTSNIDVFTPTLLSQQVTEKNSEQEQFNYLQRRILMNGNIQSKTALKNYLLKMNNLKKKQKEIEIQQIEAREDFIKAAFDGILNEDEADNTASASNINKNTRKRKFLSRNNDDFACETSIDSDNSKAESNLRENPSKKIHSAEVHRLPILKENSLKKIHSTEVYLLPINEIVYARNRTISHWASFFNDSENFELSKPEIEEINNKSEYETKEFRSIKTYVSNWNALSEKKKNAFKEALKKRRTFVEQVNHAGQIINIFKDNGDIYKDFFDNEETKKLIASGNLSEGEQEKSSISDARFRMIMRHVLGQRPKDILVAEKKSRSDDTSRKYMIVGVVLNDINTGYKTVLSNL